MIAASAVDEKIRIEDAMMNNNVSERLDDAKIGAKGRETVQQLMKLS